jgi:hypothetical protein
MTRDIHVIRIRSDYSIAIDTFDKSGTVTHKTVSPDDLGDVLLGSMKVTDVTSKLLPKNCIAWTKAPKGDASYYVIQHAEEYADIQYHETKYPHFPIPRLIFGFVVNGERLTKVNLGVIGKGELTESLEMYHYPFSNVNGFSMCTGGNKLPNIKKRTALANLPNFILSIPDGDHHYEAGNTRLNLNYRELLEHLKDKSPEYYYTDVLIKSNSKLKDFI